MRAALLKGLAGAAVAALPIVAAFALRPGSGASSAAAAPAPAATTAAQRQTHSGFPTPPPGAVVFSRELGPDALALGVVPGRGRILVQASVLGSQGQGVTGLSVGFSIGGAVQSGAACGAGCYRATMRLAGRPPSVTVDVKGIRWTVTMPAAWPPQDGSALVAGAARAWRALRSLSYRERLASSQDEIVSSTWRIEAPDRVAYEIVGGGGGVIVGGKRWDRTAGSTRWVESPQLPVTQPVPFWVSATDAHVLGTATVRGRPAWRVSFFDPGTPAWFDALIDRATLRTLDLHMITTAHFMHDVYGSFDATSPVTPPR